MNGAIARRLRSVGVFLEMIKISHSVFALPFAVAAAFLAQRRTPDALLVLKVVLACVLARTAAMSFNRWADRTIDARNPRTAGRAIPAGQLGAGPVLVASALSSALFVLVAWWINPLAFRLSPVALVVLLGYSYTKRFTPSSHVILGLALGLSPVGAWIAVREEIALQPVLLGVAVLCWTAGFDIIYACQDVEFDRNARLASIPARFGIARALIVSRLLHVGAVLLLIAVGLVGSGPYLGAIYHVGVAAVAGILVYEQSLVRADDLSRVDLAFFTLNGCVSLVYMGTTITDVLVGTAS